MIVVSRVGIVVVVVVVVVTGTAVVVVDVVWIDYSSLTPHIGVLFSLLSSSSSPSSSSAFLVFLFGKKVGVVFSESGIGAAGVGIGTGKTGVVAKALRGKIEKNTE